MSRTALYRQLLEQQVDRDKRIVAVNDEYRKMLEYVTTKEEIIAQEQEDDVSVAAVLIRYIESLEAKLAGTRLVWCNVSGSDGGGFSNSWPPEHSAITVSEALAYMEERPEMRSYKLIEYRCITDPEFEFNRFMRLR